MRIAGEVVDADAEFERADPYVLAQALQIQSEGTDVMVVTDDTIDRAPVKIALTTACERLSLDYASLEEYLATL